MGIIRKISSFVGIRDDAGNKVDVSAKSNGKNGLEVVSSSDENNQSAFGDNMTVSPEPISQISFVYGVQENEVETFNATGGTVTSADNMIELSTGTSIGGYGVARTLRSTIYREGQGILGRFTSIFDGNAVANSLQFAGFFNLVDTLAFGYSGADFGIIYRTYGEPEIRKLSATASGNGTLTLTLNGTAYNIPITSGTVQHNCTEIQDWMSANQSVWNAEQVGDTIVFQARSTGVKSGTYSISGTTFAGTFSQLESGADKTNADILQTSWDNNPSWFDPTKSNVYQIKVSYLGFGPLKFFIQNTSTGAYELVHTIKPLGTATKPSLSKRSLKIGWTAASLGSTTDLTVKGASAATFIEGESKLIGGSQAHTATNVSVGSTYESIITIRCAEVWGNEVNLGRVVPVYLSISNDATKPVEYKVVKNSSSLSAMNYQYHNETKSIVHYSETIVTDSSTDGEWIGVMSAGGAPIVDLRDLDLDLQLDETLTVYARKTSGTDPSVTASIVWKEDV